MDRRMQIYVTNRGEYFQNGVLMGTWVKLPFPGEELESVLKSIGVEGHNYFITDYETLLPNLHAASGNKGKGTQRGAEKRGKSAGD